MGGGTRTGGVFKADGTTVRNPKAFVVGLRDYVGGLFTSLGVEIRDPHAFVEGLRNRGGRQQKAPTSGWWPPESGSGDW